MEPLFKAVDRAQMFVDGMTRQRDKLALMMILHGQFPSQGWRIVECVYRDGAMLRYACYPMRP